MPTTAGMPQPTQDLKPTDRLDRDRNRQLEAIDGRAHRDPPAASTTAGAEPLREVARDLAMRCQLLESGPSAGAPRLDLDTAAAYQRLLATLDAQAEPIGPADTIVLNLALFGLARLGLVIDPQDRATASAFATNLAAVLRAHGVVLQDDLPGSRVIADSHDDDSRLRVAQQAVAERIEALTDSLGQDEPKTVLQRRIATHAPIVIELLAEVGAAVRTLRGRDGKVSKEILETLDGSCVLLSMRCHQLGLEMVPAHLDLIFDAEDRAFEASGLHPPARRATYYTAWNATDFDEDRGHRDPEAKRGEHLVEQIVTWFENGTLLQALLLSEAAAIVTEPVAQRDLSTLEKVLSYAVGALLGVVPGMLDDVMKRGVTRWLGEAPAAEHGPERVTTSLVRALAPAITKPTTRELQKGLKGAVTGTAPLPAMWPHGNGPLSTAFLRMLAVEGMADLKARVEAGGGLRDALTLVPPAGLQALWESLTDDLGAQAARGSQALSIEWANVVAASQSGEEADGTVAEDGGVFGRGADQLPAMSSLPGTLRADVVVDLAPETVPDGPGLATRRQPPAIVGAALRSLAVSELGATAKARIREAAQPLATVAMHRMITVHARGADGAFAWVGRFDVAPDGTIDVHDAALAGLAQLGRAVPIGDHTVGAAMASVDRGAAGAAARWILGATGATTAALQE